MLKKSLIPIFLFLLIIKVQGQIISLSYNWEENPVCTVLDEKESKENVVCLYIFERNEYYYDEYNNQLSYNTFHKKVKINNDEDVNSFNKIYISLSNVIEIIELKARSINPDGTIVNFDKDNIKEIKDEEGTEGYKIFAIEGIQKGADVEFFYIRKMYSDYHGRTYFQYGYPVKSGRFELISPENLFFEFKVYNDTSRVRPTNTKNLNDKRNYYSVDFKNIEGLNTPRYAYYNPLRLRIEYRLNNNASINQSQLFTWDEAARRIYDMMYQLGPKEVKSLLKYKKKNLSISESDEKEKIMKIESILKNEILVQEYGSPEFTNLDFIIKNKITTERGMVKLFANILDQFKIRHEVVLTSDRSNVKFDGSFQSWNYLESYLVYFPDLDLYLSPANRELRLGFVPVLFTATEGLFVEKVQVLDYESAIGQIKYIEPLSYEKNFSNMLIQIDINTEVEEMVHFFKPAKTINNPPKKEKI